MRVPKIAVLAVLSSLASLSWSSASSSMPVAASSPGQAGSLTLNAALSFSGSPVTCPSEPSDAKECYSVSGTGLVPGLGRVSESFVIPLVNPAAGCPPATPYRVRGFPVRLDVAGKGTIHVAVANRDECLAVEGVQGLTRDFTITGGTGPYSVASGGGTLTRRLLGAQGSDVWAGTLVVPGLEFNLTAPTIRGAVSKTVRAARGATRARVTFAVTAEDDRSGRVPVSCSPASGSLFRLGVTKVNCSASDPDGNTARASFTVRVLKAKR